MESILKKNKNFYDFSKDKQVELLVEYIENNTKYDFQCEDNKKEIFYNILIMTISASITLYSLNKFF